METGGNQLQYAPRGAWHRRPGSRRAIIGAVVLIAGLASLKFAPSAWGHAKLLYWQRLCMRYEQPASRVIDPDDTGGNKQWMEYYAMLSPPGRKPAPIVALHEMRRPDGAARLIAIELTAARTIDMMIWVQGFDYHVIQPGGLWSRPRLVNNRFWHAEPLARWGNGDLKFFAAQTDPADAAHLTIGFEFRRNLFSLPRRGQIDAWLYNDDSIKFEVRN